MFPSSSRPRAPSTATLKVLYQLAYISSGTALGVGALCAEERRRRTTVVQKIADNARRLRQTPRYNHGAAAAAIRDIETGQDIASFHPFGHLNGQEGSTLAPELPSVISREYDYVCARQQSAGRRRLREEVRARSTNVLESSAPGSVPRSGRDGRKLRNSGINSEHAIRSGDGPIRGGSLAHLPSTMAADKQSGVLASLLRNSTKLPDTIHYTSQSHSARVEGTTELMKESSARRRLYHRNKQPRHERAGQPIIELPSGFLTRRAWRKSVKEVDLPTSARITSDVDLFLDTVSEDTPAHMRMSLTQARDISNHLFRLAARAGNFEDTLSLLLWQIAVGTLELHHVTMLTDSWESLSAVAGNEAVASLVSQAFQAGVRKEEDPVKALWVALDTTVRFLDHNTSEDGVMDKKDFLPFTFAIRSPHYKQVAESYCERLLAEGRLHSALELITAIKYRKWSPESSRSLAQNLFSQSLASGSISSCLAVVHWAGSSLAKDHLTTDEIEAYIKLCSSMRAHHMLRAFFCGRDYDLTESSKPLKHLLSTRALSRGSCIEIANAFVEGGHTYQKVLQLCLAHMSEDDRAVVANGSIRARAEVMSRKWHKTRNITRITEMYDSALGEDIPGGDSSILHSTMARIALEGNDADMAARAIRMLDAQKGLSFAAVLLCCLLHAQRKDWHATESLLNDMAITKVVESQWTPDNMQTFEEILRAYAQAHDAQSTQRFCTSIIDLHALTLNRRMTTIILQKFVEDKRADLLGAWLTQQRQQGNEVKVDEPLGSQLLRHLFYSHQPSSVWLLEQCFDMLALRPHLAGPSLKAMLVEATAHDIRTNKSQHAWWQVPEAQKRLKLLVEAPNLQQLASQIQGLGKSVQYLTAPEPSQQTMHDKATLESELAPEVLQRTSHSTNLFQPELSAKKEDMYYPDEHAGATQGIQDFLQHVAHSDISSDNTQHGSSENAFGLSRKSDTPSELDAPIGPLWDDVQHEQHSTPKDELPARAFGLEDIGNQYSFADLRPEYSTTEIQQAPTYAVVTQLRTEPNGMPLHTRMLAAFSSTNYGEVIAMYKETCDHTGVPSSPFALELAVESSLRMHNGQPEEAFKVIAAARDAGMNTTCAAGPMLRHRTRQLTNIDRACAQALCRDVTRYYRQNHADGWFVKHHLAVDTAHVLVRAGFPRQGIAILESVYRSDWAVQRPLDIVAMTVWLTGYGHLQDMEGVRKIVGQVLDSNMRIDEPFIRALQKLKANFQPFVLLPHEHTGQSYAQIVAQLNDLRQACVKRRAQHRAEVKTFSRELVTVLAKHAHGPSLTTKYAIAPRQGQSRRQWSKAANHRPFIQVR